MESTNTLYTLVNMSRSFDKYHVDKNRIHLVSSVFCTNKFELTEDTKFSSVHYIIRIEFKDSKLFDIIEHNSNCIEFRISIVYLIENFLMSINNRIEGFESFLQILIGNYFEIEKTNHSLLNNVLFVYQDITWSTIQLIFRLINIDVSGGSISKRHMISTAEYNLSRILYTLDYRLEDIYNSSKIYSFLLKTSNFVSYSELFNDYKFNNVLKLEEIKRLLTLEIENITKHIKELELLIKSSSGSLKEFEISMSNLGYNDSKTNSNKLKNRSSLKLNYNILNAKNKIENLTSEVSSLNLKLIDLNKEKSNLDNLNNSEIQEKYIKLIINNKGN